MMTSPDDLKLPLLGGPLHRVGVRLGLVRGDSDTTRLGLAIGAGLWVALVAAAFADGATDRLFSMSVVGCHARLLLALPLFFVCERWFSPCASEFVGGLRCAGVVCPDDLPALTRAVARARRLTEGWLVDAACLAAGAAAAFVADYVGLFGHSAARPAGGPALDAPLAVGWYWYVCLPVFRFLFFRLVWRVMVWWWFLWRVSRLDLRLEPTHPDAAGGLGYLEVVQTQFLPLVAALAVVQSAGFAEGLSTESIELPATIPYVLFVVIVGLVVTVTPLLFFSGRLHVCRTQGLSRYMQFASDYVARFDAKWLRDRSNWGDSTLGNPDVQSLSDLGASGERVAATRILVTSRGMLTLVVVAAIGPMIPLLLFEYPADELAEKFLRLLTGV